MSSVTFRTGADSWVNQAAPSQMNGKFTRTRIKGTSEYTFLQLDLHVPRGAKIQSATLRVYGRGDWGASVTVNCQRVAAKWSETLIDWNNKPGVTGPVVSLTQHETTDATEWAFPVTALVQTIVNGAPNYGFRLSTADANEHFLYSLQASDNRPVLDVQWSDAPDAPTELSPSGGSAVAIAKPVLQFNFHDISGDGMQACQVQLNPTNSFGAPAFDSGTVATADPELDLTTTAYAGIANGASAWWRVKVQNDAGDWSGWTDPANFQRIDKMTVTNNNPAASPNNFVEDATPEFSWTVTPGPQTGRRIIIADDADPTHPKHDTGHQTTSETTWTPPKGVITSETTVYRETLRIWENDTRTLTPGDKVYIESVRTFTYQPDATISPTATLTAQQVANGQPHVQLTFTRATAPDGWTIFRDGNVIEHNLDPADLFVSGITYQYIDRTAEPHTNHTWTARPRVNGKTGPAGPVASLSYDVDAIWLCDPDTGKLVPVIVDDSTQVTFAMPEINGLYLPVDGDEPITLTQGQFGLSGNVTDGKVVDGYGGAAAFWVANFLWIKVRPQLQLRVTVGGFNVRCSLRNMEAVPLEGGNADDRSVRFDFASLDGVTQQ